MDIKDLLQLAGKNGKVIIVNEDGEVKGVFLSEGQYAGLTPKNGVGDKIAVPALDPEVVNREILQAQLSDNVDLDNKNLETIAPVNPIHMYSPPSPIKNILARRARDLFVSSPYGRQEPPEYDMREEVMDPTFGQPPIMQTPSASPMVEDSDEEIKPNFDDI
ncbi:hypothetical protein IPM19_01150 [bacterium]|nr:MAG: hypothetical protein IPM19_01150 [bacterium]